MFYYVLYQSKLVPRWISGWGLIAAILYLAVGLVGRVPSHHSDVDDPGRIESSTGFAGNGSGGMADR